MALRSGLRADARFILNALPDQRLRKHLLWWLRSKQENYLLTHSCPWLTFDAILALRSRIRPGLRIFEYGSGGSTLFWLANNAAQIVSVEHDPAWHQVVAERVKGKPCINLRLILPEVVEQPGSPHEPADPTLYQSDDEHFRGYAFREYVRQIDSFPDHYFDVLLIDGRARTSCIAHGASKVKVGGMLVLDNAERPYYTARTAQHLHGFARETFPGMVPQVPVLSSTDIYTRGDSPVG